MKIRQTPSKVLQEIINPLVFKKEEGKNYRLHKYCIYFNNDDGNFIIYNNLSKACVEFAPDESIYDCDYLYSKGFLVEESFNEEFWAKYIGDTIEGAKKTPLDYKKIKSFLILPTLECNARCFYCYEKTYNKYPMSEKVANDTADFIIKNSSEKKTKLSWFGGEPLFNQKAIDIIVDKLLEEGFTITSSMISNGYLFDEETIKKAKEKWNLKRVQITIDGTEEYYNKAKNYIYKGVNPFKTIINNIHNLVKNNIRVSIRINVGYYNCDDAENLINFLFEEFKEERKLVKLFNIYVHDLFGIYDNDINGEEQRKKVFNKLMEFNKKLNYTKKETNKFKITRCMADGHKSIGIMPNGDIVLCEHCDKDTVVGSIYSEEKNQEAIDRLAAINTSDEKCLNCPLYLSGCPRMPVCCESKTCSEERKLYLVDKKIMVIKKFLNK